MKKSILVVICSLFIFNLYAQDHFNCDSVYLQAKHVIKSDEPCLMTAINYVLDRPLIDNSEVHKYSMGFVLTWMEKTPEFTFNLNDNVLNLCKDDNLPLFNIYLSCLAKAAIETKKDYIPAALKLFVTYLERPDNKVKQTAKIKKMMAQVKEGKLEKYM